MLADGWGFSQMSGGNSMGHQHPGAIKQQTIGLLHAIAYLRGELTGASSCKLSLGVSAIRLTMDCECAVPLIASNAVVILVKLLFG